VRAINSAQTWPLLEERPLPIRVEIYAAAGIAVGVVASAGHLRDVLETGGRLVLEGATWHPLDGQPSRTTAELAIEPDDIHLAFSDESTDGPVHAQWHDVELDVGPYRIHGQLPTMPGFDPGRALARPTGEFVPIRDVTIGLAGDDANESVVKQMVLVNRYVVDRVAADLMLGFFFPGAKMITTGGSQVVSAGVGTTAGPERSSGAPEAPVESNPTPPTATPGLG
jgi:hypothetical protein